MKPKVNFFPLLCCYAPPNNNSKIVSIWVTTLVIDSYEDVKENKIKVRLFEMFSTTYTIYLLLNMLPAYLNA